MSFWFGFRRTGLPAGSSASMNCVILRNDTIEMMQMTCVQLLVLLHLQVIFALSIETQRVSEHALLNCAVPLPLQLRESTTDGLR